MLSDWVDIMVNLRKYNIDNFQQQHTRIWNFRTQALSARHTHAHTLSSLSSIIWAQNRGHESVILFEFYVIFTLIPEFRQPTIPVPLHNPSRHTHAYLLSSLVRKIWAHIWAMNSHIWSKKHVIILHPTPKPNFLTTDDSGPNTPFCTQYSCW